MELQQTPLYGKYIETFTWDVIRVDDVQMFYKHIPFMGGLLKIQRPAHLPTPAKLIPILKTHNVKTVAIEPIQTQDIKSYTTWCKTVEKHCRVNRSVYMPAKTILVDLSPTEDEIFARFSEAKRRAVRKAQKNGITVEESGDIKNLIHIKNKSGGFFGFITTVGIDKLWAILAPKHATVLLAYSKNRRVIGGILLVFWGDTAFYWIAGATREGKKIFAPTLLVWEALKVSKKFGSKLFDFVGVWDERTPNDHKDWLGFTKFKEGFGGTNIYYPIY